jgi:Tol biopolymer transport system component
MKPILLFLPLLAAAADSPYLSLVNATTQFRQVAISPDAAHVAYIEGVRNPDNSESRATLLYLTTGGGTPKRISGGTSGAKCQDKDVAWSPDSRQIAFVSDCASPRQLQLYVADVATGKARKLTSLRG